jgi:glutamyl-tRNA synthetase
VPNIADGDTSMRGRFAPTPSGKLHLGNARTALLAWLQVRKAGGQFILRMEDIDQPRCKPELAVQILTDLRWLGLNWDEGPDIGGPLGPYEQSLRHSLYLEAVERLQEAGWLYPCCCTRAEIAAVARAPHGLSEEGPQYPGTCRSPAAAQRRAASGKRPSLRFALPDEATHFTDQMAGEQRFAPGAGGDFVIRRADGIFSYQLAVVVDDAAMQVTDILRGSDLLDSTPRQIWLYRALGYSIPRFAHVPLLLGPDGNRLSKRHRDLTVSTLRESGVAPEQVVGGLAFLSGLIDRPEPLTAKELVAPFNLEKVPREPVILSRAFLAALDR